MRTRFLAVALMLGLLLVPSGVATARPGPLTDFTQCEVNSDFNQCITLTTDGEHVVAASIHTDNLSSANHEICADEVAIRGSGTYTWPTCIPGQGGAFDGTWVTNWALPQTVCAHFDTSLESCVTASFGETFKTASLDGVPEATGCSTSNTLKQCVFVSGFANHVDFVKGTEYGIATGRICGTERLLKDGATYKSSSLCVPKGTGASASITWNLNQSYSTGTQFCTQMTTNAGTKSGKPCETVG